MLHSGEASFTLTDVFAQRKDSFLDSLQHILKGIGGDLFISQMFNDKSSNIYVPDRICEIITKYLESDREDYILSLEKKIQSFEACFGQKRVKKFEEIGNKLLDHSEKMQRMKNFNPADQKTEEQYFQDIQEELKNYKTDVNRKLHIVQFDESRIQNIKSEISQITENVKLFNQFVQKTKKDVLSSIQKFHKDSITSVQKFHKETINSVQTMKEKIDFQTQNEQKFNGLLKQAQNDLNHSKIELAETSKKHQDELLHLQSQYDSTIANLSNEKSELERKNVQLENQLNLYEHQLKLKDSSIQTYNEEKAKNNKQFDLNIQQIRERDKEIANLRHSLSKASYTDDQNQLNQKIASLESDLQFTRAKLAEASKIGGEKNALSHQLKILQDENFELKKNLTEQEIEVQTLQQEIKDLKESFLTANKESHKNKHLTKKIQQLLQTVSVLKNENISLSTSLEEYQSKTASFENKNSLLIKSLTEKTDLIHKLRETMSQTIESDCDKSELLDDLKDKIAEYENAIQIISKKIKVKEKHFLAISEENQKLKAELKSVRSELDQMKRNLESNSDEINDLKAMNNSKDVIITSFQNSLKHSVNQTKEIGSSEIAQKDSMIKLMEENEKALKSEIEKQEGETKKLNEKLVELENKLKKEIQTSFAISTENETLKSINSKQETELQDAQNTNLDLQSKIHDYESMLKNNEDTMKRLKTDNERTINEMQMVRSNLDFEKEKHQNDIKKLQDDIANLTSEQNVLQHQIDELKFDKESALKLVESKEKELQVEKEKNAEDLIKVKNLTAKIVEDSLQLQMKNQNFEKNLAESFNQLNEIAAIETFDDIPKEIEQLKKYKIDHDEFLLKLYKALSEDDTEIKSNQFSFEYIETRVNDLKRRNQEFRSKIENI